MMPPDNYGQTMLNQQQQQMPFPQQMLLMNNGMPLNSASLNGNMYPQYLDQYQLNSNLSQVPTNNMMNGQANGLQMAEQNNYQQQMQPPQVMLAQQQPNLPIQQQQQQPIYLNQQQQQPVQYQQMSFNGQPAPAPQQQIMYNQSHQQIQAPASQQIPYQYQQNTIQVEAKENSIKEAQLISFD
jgi:hypothetical protein